MSCVIARLKNFNWKCLNIPSVRFYFNEVKNVLWQLCHTFILQVLSEFFKPALPVLVVCTCCDGSHWKVNRKLCVALAASYNFLIGIWDVSEESLPCKLNFTEETLTLPNVSAK